MFWEYHSGYRGKRAKREFLECDNMGIPSGNHQGRQLVLGRD